MLVTDMIQTLKTHSDFSKVLLSNFFTHPTHLTFVRTIGGTPPVFETVPGNPLVLPS